MTEYPLIIEQFKPPSGLNYPTEAVTR